MTKTKTTHDVIARYYALACAGQWDAWLDLFHEDVLMEEQLFGRIEGLPALRKLMLGDGSAPSEGPNSYFANVPTGIMAVEGERALVLSHLTVVQRSDGKRIEVDVVNIFEVRDGLIAYFKNVHDTKPF